MYTMGRLVAENELKKVRSVRQPPPPKGYAGKYGNIIIMDGACSMVDDVGCRLVVLENWL